MLFSLDWTNETIPLVCAVVGGGLGQGFPKTLELKKERNSICFYFRVYKKSFKLKKKVVVHYEVVKLDFFCCIFWYLEVNRVKKQCLSLNYTFV